MRKRYMIGVPLAMPLAIKIYFSRWLETHFNGAETVANNPGQIIQLKVICIQRQIHCSYTM